MGFMEGNREYFVHHTHADVFTWCDAAACRRDGPALLFCHGDQIDPRRHVVRLFLRCSKNALARRAMRRLPWGPPLSRLVQRGYRKIIPVHQGPLPRDQIRNFAEARFQENVRLILSGHFHRAYSYHGARGGVFHALPDWHATGLITLCDPSCGMVRHIRDDAPEINQLSTRIDFEERSA